MLDVFAQPHFDPLVPIWDIQEEHLDEAEFLLELWTNGVDSPSFTLAKLRQGPEDRLLARIEALRVGGEEVVAGLLLPVLDDPEDDEFRTAAATLAILHGAGLEACERVLAAFDASEVAGHRGLVRGLQLSRRDGLITWLARDLDQLAPLVLASRLEILAAHRVNAGARLVAWLQRDELEVRRAAALLARHTGAPPALQLLHPLMHAEDDALRWAAIESGLIRGQMPAWHALAHEATQGPLATRRAALAWLAMLGDAALHQQLLARLRAAPSPALIWAAGLSGRLEAVDAALELLDDPQLARPAGELVASVAGLPLDDESMWLDRGVRVGDEDDEALPELELDDLEREPVPTSDQRLRLPRAEAVRSWWAARRCDFDPKLRHVAGLPLEIRQLSRSLYTLPTRRRHPLALELAARSSGRAQIASSAFALVQDAQTQELFGRVAFLDFQRGLPLAS
jgi:uncharacterized protein (TIGR02270 family)